MKKEQSGKIVFSVYALFLVGMFVLSGFVADMAILVATALGALAMIASTVLEFIGGQIVRGYAVAGLTSLVLFIFFLFHLIFPVARGMSVFVLLVSAGVFYHCYRTLKPKNA